ncbi:hypothetical protein D3C81_1676870 [compost metagenome]
MLQRSQMEHIVHTAASSHQRILISDISDNEAESVIFVFPAHRYLDRLAAGEDNDLFWVLRQKLPDKFMPPGTRAAGDHNPFIIKHAGSLQAKI